MDLIIVESPTKARTLAKFLGHSYQITATMGHMRDLPEKKLGIDIIPMPDGEPGFEFHPQYQSITGRKQNIKELKSMAGHAQRVILATDPDREGEAIAWHVSEILSKERKNRTAKELKNKKSNDSDFIHKPTSSSVSGLIRIVFHEITESAIKEALDHPRKIDMQLVDAQQARRILDRLVGYKLSPLLWNKLGKNWLSAGRVQSVAVRLIVDREREIEAFKSREYWLIDVELNKMSLVTPFIARLTQIDGKKAEFKARPEIENILDNLKKSDYKVTDVITRESKRFAPAPFTTSTLQQTAATRFGWSARRTIKTAQTLYEEGYITYHRTDSTNVAKEAVEAARLYINNVYGTAYLPVVPKIYKTKSKVAQEAHEAIRPSDVTRLSHQDSLISPIDVKSDVGIKSLPEDLGRDGQMLYSLIWRRFLACQMNEAVFDQTGANIQADFSDKGGNVRYIFRATGERIKFDGWLKLYPKSQPGQAEKTNDQKDGDDGGVETKNKDLPALANGEQLVLKTVIPLQKFTEPPARYSEASLIKILEEKGIGRPSTYAPIITTIQDRKYVEKIERRFQPTDLGKTVNDFLVKYFPDIFDIGFTAGMENELDDIANGKMSWNKVVSDFYTPFYAKLSQVFKEAERVKVDLGKTDEKCPLCGKVLVIRISKFGKFLACSTFPVCKFTKNLVEKVGINCPKCGGDMLVKKTRRGKHFYGCTNYPKCTFAAWKKEDIK